MDYVCLLFLNFFKLNYNVLFYRYFSLLHVVRKVLFKRFLDALG